MANMAICAIKVMVICCHMVYPDYPSRSPTSSSGVVEVKFRAAQRRELMHRLDEKLQKLDEQMSLGRWDM